MPKKIRRRYIEAVQAMCLTVMVEQLTEASEMAKTAGRLIAKGRERRAMDLALAIEPLLHDANRAIQSASLLQWQLTRAADSSAI